MLRVKRWRAVGFAVLAAVATFPCARAGEAHIKYVYELGASPNDGANPGNLLVINPSAMTVTVPAGAASGPLTIIAATGARQTPGTFTVTP